MSKFVGNAYDTIVEPNSCLAKICALDGCLVEACALDACVADGCLVDIGPCF